MSLLLRCSTTARQAVRSFPFARTVVAGKGIIRSESTTPHHHHHHLQQQQYQSTFTYSESHNNHAPEHHTDHHEQPQVEWTMFHGKIPILTNTSAATTASTSNATQVTRLDDNIPATTTTTTTASSTTPPQELPRISILMELTDRCGILAEVLRYFWKYDINICRIESRPLQKKVGGFDFFVDFDCNDPAAVQKLLWALQPITNKLLLLDEKQVQWFPRHVSELDCIADRTLEAGDLLQSDHPGFNDPVYRQRRAMLTQSALHHRWDQDIPLIEYTAEETAVWTAVWDKMEGLWDKYACQEYLQVLDVMKEGGYYRRDAIPQQRDISSFLYKRTGFRMRPVAGLLSSRDFLNGLAFRVFFCTQYIRHWSKPLYTPEPDICHELLGHAPMFADHDFADFSQEIGLASLGASDEDIDKLAHCYWHSVEFGLCKEGDSHKAYGAGLLSSFGELEHACQVDTTAQILPWDPAVAAKTAFPITTYQPIYFLAESLADAKEKMRAYCEELPRPFFALYNAQTESVHIDRPVKRTKGVPETFEK